MCVLVPTVLDVLLVVPLFAPLLVVSCVQGLFDECYFFHPIILFYVVFLILINFLGFYIVFNFYLIFIFQLSNCVKFGSRTKARMGTNLNNNRWWWFE